MQTMNTAPGRNLMRAAGMPGKAPMAPKPRAPRVPTGNAPKGYPAIPHGGPVHNGKC